MKPLHQYFADISEADGSDYQKGIDYIQQKYQEAFNGSIMYPYTTNALDTENCNRVFSALKDNVLNDRLNLNFE